MSTSDRELQSSYTYSIRPELTRQPARSMIAPGVACISSDQLLRGSNEVQIEHHGVLYRLKQTSLGKLILTK
jgi:hemin uptake protein HemP